MEIVEEKDQYTEENDIAEKDERSGE